MISRPSASSNLAAPTRICRREEVSAGYQSHASFHTSAIAGTMAVMVTALASIAAKASSKAAVWHMTTVPPWRRVPRMPGLASGKSCEVESTAM